MPSPREHSEELTSTPAIYVNERHDALVAAVTAPAQAAQYFENSLDASGVTHHEKPKPIPMSHLPQHRQQSKRKLVQGQTIKYYQNRQAHIHSVARKNMAMWQAHAADMTQPTGIRIIEQNAGKNAFEEDHTGDFGEAAYEVARLTGEKPFVLNMANATTVGGAYLNGAGAQEENMHRRTNCWIDNPDTPLYDDATSAEIKNGVFYRDDRVLFRQSEANAYAMMPEDEWYEFAECRLAGISLRQSEKLTREQTAEYRQKIYAMLKLAKKSGHKHLVLGALGCGAFQNDPKVIAAVFKEQIDLFQTTEGYEFTSITFPILVRTASDRANVSAFQNAFYPDAELEESAASAPVDEASVGGSGLRLGDSEKKADKQADADTSLRAEGIDFTSQKALSRISRIFTHINDADSAAGTQLSKTGQTYRAVFKNNKGFITDSKSKTQSTLSLLDNGVELDKTTPAAANVAITVFVCNFLAVDDLPDAATLAKLLKGADIHFYGDGADLFKQAFERITGVKASELRPITKTEKKASDASRREEAAGDTREISKADTPALSIAT